MQYSASTFLIQTGLKSLGFDPGPLDGKDGPRTQAAFLAFEASTTPTTPRQPLELPTSDPVRTVNQAGLDLIKHFEGLYLKAYLCPANVWTIGYGHTGLTHKDGSVRAGRTITQEEAERLLIYDLEKFAKRVQDTVKVQINDDQFAALVSFDFNTGGLLKSTLLKKLNAGDYQGAADEFLKWTKANGKELAGLVRRRKSERALFLTGKFVP